MQEDATDRVAIVTGGSRGIGLAIAKTFARDGVRVTVTYGSGANWAEQARAELNEIGRGLHQVVQSDAGDIEAAAALVNDVGERHGRIDYLINNAAVAGFQFLEEMTPDAWNRMMSVNLTGPIFLSKAVVPWMNRNRFGRILNASSISGSFADVGQIGYGCSKAGIEIFTRIAAAELAPYGITVNAYAPGIIKTEMTRAMIEDRGDLQVKQIPAGYFGEPDEVAGLIRFLCGPDAGYLTGEVIGIDGGMLKVQNPQRGPGYPEH